MKAAFQVRLKAGKKLTMPISIFDFVEEYGVEVRFVNYTSLEGMFYKGKKPLILISSMRPLGRQAFNCAHEFGHYIFEHGTKVDELNNNKEYTPEEYMADTFASSILMPKMAICSNIYKNKLKKNNFDPLQIYTIACLLGVGYGTLLSQMFNSVHLLTKEEYLKLNAFTVKKIKALFTGEEFGQNLIVSNEHWQDKAIDTVIGDYIITPKNTEFEGINSIWVKTTNYGELFMTIKAGTGKFVNDKINWNCYIRSMKKEYKGRSKFRFLEDSND